MLTFVVGAIWVVLLLTARYTESRQTMRRHVELFKQALREELHQIQLEKLSTPGGKFFNYQHDENGNLKPVSEC